MKSRFRHFLLKILLSSLLFSLSGLKAQDVDNARILGGFNSGHEVDRWYFGDSAGLDFRGTQPVADLTNESWIATSPSIISDHAGNILFYSDGPQIRNRLLQVMANGDSLHGSYICTMPCLIAPKPGSDHLYYLFTIGRVSTTPSDTITKYGLQYSVVDMHLDTGMGMVTEKNIVLTEPEVSSKLTGVKHSNGIDYWIVVHMFNSDEFRAFLLTENGIDTDQMVSSHIGSFHLPPGKDNNAVGYMKFSPDGTKLALNIYGSGIIEIFDFNCSTGQVTNAVTSTSTFNDAYGLEFSPDSRFLYVSAISVSLPEPGYVPPSFLFQFDISKGAGIFSQGNYDTVVKDTSGSYFGGMQIGSDGRIYITRGPNGNTKVSVFQNPVRQGEACNFSLDTISLGGRTSNYGFPNFITSYLNLTHFDLDIAPGSQTVSFNLRNTNNVDSVLWNFGDPSSNENTSREFQPGHTFSSAGVYEVSVTEYFDGETYGPYKHVVQVNLSILQDSDNDDDPDIKFSPDPVSDWMMITFPDNTRDGMMDLVMYDLFRREVMRKEAVSANRMITLEVSGLSCGLYIVVCKDQQNRVVKGKFVVAH